MINSFIDIFVKTITMNRNKKLEQVREDLLNVFNRLEFDEKRHIYTVNGVVQPSVSKKLKRFYNGFEAKKMAPFSAAKWNRENPDKPEKTANDILREWRENAQEAAAMGHRVHSYAEEYPTFSREPVCNKECGVVNYYDSLDNNYGVVLQELKMHSLKFGYAGTLDLLLYNFDTDRLCIRDWKTNKDLFKNYKGKKMLYPFTTWLDCPMNHYKVQLNHYKILIEEETPYEIEDMALIWLNDEIDNNYKVYNVPDHSARIRNFYDPSK